MDKTLVGLIGAVGALAAASPAQAAGGMPAAIDDVMHAGTYADLLRPIPNAGALLREADARLAERADVGDTGKVMEVQYYYHHHHHHHHHHHRYYRPRYYHHHHHHHHHHHRAAIVTPFGVIVR